MGTCWWIQIKNATKQNYALSVNFCWRVLINNKTIGCGGGCRAMRLWSLWPSVISTIPTPGWEAETWTSKEQSPNLSKSLIYSWSTPLEDFNEQLQLQLGQACHSCSFSRDISFFFRTPSAVILFMAACSKAFDGCERCRPWPRAAQLCS